MSADEVIAVSEGLYREFIANGIPETRLHLIPNGIDLERFDQAITDIATSQDYRDYSTPVVGTIGRLVEQKGLDLFIEAAARVAAQRSDVVFQIAGEGPLRDPLTQQIATLGLTDRIQLCSAIDRMCRNCCSNFRCSCRRRAGKACPTRCWKRWRRGDPS